MTKPVFLFSLEVSELEAAILDWYSHMLISACAKRAKCRGSGGMLSQENFMKLGVLISLLRPSLGQKLLQVQTSEATRSN